MSSVGGAAAARAGLCDTQERDDTEGPETSPANNLLGFQKQVARLLWSSTPHLWDEQAGEVNPQALAVLLVPDHMPSQVLVTAGAGEFCHDSQGASEGASGGCISFCQLPFF